MISLQKLIESLNEESGIKLCIAIENGNNRCFNKVKCKNLCGKHYSRQRRLGSINLAKKERKCKFIDCNEPHKARGFCQKHYGMYHKKGKKCSIDNCFKNIYAKDLCRMHYERTLRHGSPHGKSDFKPDINANLLKKGVKRYIPPRKNLKCIYKDCNHTFETSVIRKGLCEHHYYLWHKQREKNK